MLHLVSYFVINFLSEIDLGYVKLMKVVAPDGTIPIKPFNEHDAFIAWIKGTFNGEEGLGQKSSIQSIMHHIIGNIHFRDTFT